MARPDRAEEELRKVTEGFRDQQDPVNWARVSLIDALNFQGKHEAALQQAGEVRKAFQARSASPLQLAWACVKAGGIKKALGRREEALVDFEEVLKLPGDDAGPWVEAAIGKCEVLLGTSRLVEAIEPLRRAVDLARSGYPHQAAWARVRLAESLYQTSSYSQAAGVAEDLIASAGSPGVTPDQVVWGMVWKAKALLNLERFQETAATLEGARAERGVSPRLGFDVLMLSGHAFGKWSEVVPEEPETGDKLRKAALDFYQDALAKAAETHLGRESQALARLAAGSEMDRLGQRDRAISSLRAGISGTTGLEGPEALLAKRIGDLLDREESIQWQKYLLDPSSEEDPTARFLGQDKPGSRPPAGSSDPAFEFAQRNDLGKAYLAVGDHRAAEKAFLQLEADFAGPGEKGKACLGLVECYRAWSQQAPSGEAYSDLVKKTRDAARRGAGYWVRQVQEGTPSDAHGAIESGVRIYVAAGMIDEAQELAERFVAELDPVGDASKHAFARFQRMRLLGDLGTPSREVAILAEDIWLEFGGSTDLDLREISVIALLWGTSYYAAGGDAASGLRLIDELQNSWAAERHSTYISDYRARWAAR
jgi:tetratricopeptide (TPR) repeat protein